MPIQRTSTNRLMIEVVGWPAPESLARPASAPGGLEAAIRAGNSGPARARSSLTKPHRGLTSTPVLKPTAR
jgi:hypothetical protein